MKKYFAVSFKYSESVYCSNIAHAENVEAVKAHYSKYEWVEVREAEAYELDEAKRKGKPIIEIETPVVHGWWEWITEDVYGCTNCCSVTRVDECMGMPKCEYCPNCGAKMDLEV